MACMQAWAWKWCGQQQQPLPKCGENKGVGHWRLENMIQHHPLTINGSAVERVGSTKFLGMHITEDLSRSNNTASFAKRAQQRLYVLCKLKRTRALAPIMCSFYRCSIESILTSCINAWFGSCSTSNHKTLQRIVNAAGEIIGASLPTSWTLTTAMQVLSVMSGGPMDKKSFKVILKSTLMYPTVVPQAGRSTAEEPWR